MIVPRYRMDSYGRQCFAVVGPSTWNSLPDSLHDPALSLSIFRHYVKTHFFANYWRDLLSALEIFKMIMRYINFHFSYFLRYLLVVEWMSFVATIVRMCFVCSHHVTRTSRLWASRPWASTSPTTMWGSTPWHMFFSTHRSRSSPLGQWSTSDSENSRPVCHL